MEMQIQGGENITRNQIVPRIIPRQVIHLYYISLYCDLGHVYYIYTCSIILMIAKIIA